MAEVKLPELIGTEKQVKWAEDIRKDVLETLDRCWKIVEKEGKEGEYQRHYDRLVTQIETSEYALELIDRFKSISYKEQLIDKIDVLKRGFRIGTRFFNFAQNKMF